MSKEVNQLADHFFRHNYAKMTAILTGYFGLKDVEIAEDIVQDTLVEAMEKWSLQSVPQNPEGWLMDVAKKKTINFLRRHQNFHTKVAPRLRLNSESVDLPLENDSTLKMIFACCHPLLPMESQIALALKTLCGLSVPEIANALLTNDSTINKRLYRAKQKFREGSIPYKLPKKEELSSRLEAVFSTLYLLFNEGYYSHHSENLIRMDLCFEAIRLTTEVSQRFESSRECKALLSLMYLSVARFEGRMDDEGAIIILMEQDRTMWDQEFIALGIDYLHQASGEEDISKYHLYAGIAAEHCLADSFSKVNWTSIYQQYTLLERMVSNPIVQLNKTIAQFYGMNQEEALSELLSLGLLPQLRSNVHYYSALGIFHQELGRSEEAKPYFEMALTCSNSTQEQALINRRMNN